MKNILKIKRCLISVSDKKNIVSFATFIRKKNVEIVSTGNAYNKLKEARLKVFKVDSLTKFPEILEGKS